MVVYSVNDSSVALGCQDVDIAFWTQLFGWALVILMYLLFKAAAWQSTPPQLIGGGFGRRPGYAPKAAVAVSRGWTPHHLRTYTRPRVYVEE
jgi:hypothetical protein